MPSSLCGPGHTICSRRSRAGRAALDMTLVPLAATAAAISRIRRSVAVLVVPVSSNPAAVPSELPAWQEMLC